MYYFDHSVLNQIFLFCLSGTLFLVRKNCFNDTSILRLGSYKDVLPPTPIGCYSVTPLNVVARCF